MLLVELLVNGLLEGSRIALVGLGFALIFYTTKELHFAYGALITAAGYACYWMIVTLGITPWVAVPGAVLLSAAAGAVVRRYLYQRLSNPNAVLLFSFGLAIAVENGLHMIFGVNDVLLPPSFLTQSVVLFDAVHLRVIDLVAVVLFVVAWVGLAYVLKRTRTGLAFRAIMRDAQSSELVGISVARIRILAYAVGSALGGLGALITLARSGLQPGAGFDIMLFAFIITLLGVGSIHRVALWGLGLGAFMGFVSFVLPTEFRTLLAFAAMFVYLIVRSVPRPRSLRWRRPQPSGSST